MNADVLCKLTKSVHDKWKAEQAIRTAQRKAFQEQQMNAKFETIMRVAEETAKSGNFSCYAYKTEVSGLKDKLIEAGFKIEYDNQHKHYRINWNL